MGSEQGCANGAAKAWPINATGQRSPCNVALRRCGKEEEGAEGSQGAAMAAKKGGMRWGDVEEDGEMKDSPSVPASQPDAQGVRTVEEVRAAARGGAGGAEGAVCVCRARSST